MHKMKTLEKRIVKAGITALMLLVCVLFSNLYIAAETDHECTGEDCPVCICIQQCENTLHSIYSTAVLRATLTVEVLLVLYAAILNITVLIRETPVFRKIRLNI